MDVSQLLTGSGAAGLVVALAYVGRLLLDWRTKRGTAGGKVSAPVKDANAANATLVNALDSLQTENVRLADRIARLEAEQATKDAKIADLERRVRAIGIELAELKGST